MIKFHPNKQMLAAFSAGELPLSLSIAMSAHIELCDECAAKAVKIEAQLSHDTWQDTVLEEANFGDMLQAIMSNEPTPVDKIAIKPKTVTQVGGNNYQLPTAFSNFNCLKWSGFGPVSRARVISDEQHVRASLLYIAAQGKIPEHHHKGYELTLLLEGSFEDEMGTYQKGDFIWIDGELNHSPYTEKGCLCYAVQNAPLHFVRGMSKVLNPLGNLIY